MGKWLDLSLDERKVKIQRVREVLKIDESAIEKDWWVTAVLYSLFQTSIADYLLFKGGTSLSKGWNIINRFSEDIDLALDRNFFLNVKKLSCAKCANNTQLHALREHGQDFLFGEFKDELNDVMKKTGLVLSVQTEEEFNKDNGKQRKVIHDKDPSVLYIKYPSLYSNQTAYSTPSIKIEISVLSMSEPFEMRQISSLIEQMEDDPNVDGDMVQTVRTISPARTLLEKAFLLCEEYQKNHPRTRRMTRHFYDLEKLMHTKYLDIALNNPTLYYNIVKHRRKFYHVGYVDYEKELPSQIQIVPKEELMPLFEKDYEEMKANFIYGTSLDFKTLMEQMEILQNRFREIKY